MDTDQFSSVRHDQRDIHHKKPPERQDPLGVLEKALLEKLCFPGEKERPDPWSLSGLAFESLEWTRTAFLVSLPQRYAAHLGAGGSAGSSSPEDEVFVPLESLTL